MTATIAFSLDLADAAGAADEVDALNDHLAATPLIPPEVRERTRAVAAGVRATDIDRWQEIDPYLGLLVHRAVIEAQEAIERPEDPGARDALRIALERLSHALSSIAEAEEVGDERPAKEVARWLTTSIEVPQRDLAELLGVELRRFQRWISPRESARPEGEDALRVRAVARLVGQLRHAFTAVGVLRWFDWPRSDLGGRTPRELLHDPARLPDLMRAAGSTRSTALT
jgi:hypothetical protein